MPITPSHGRTTVVLIAAFIFVVLGAIYFKAESGSVAAVTMAGEKSLASYKAEMEAKAAEKIVVATTEVEEDSEVATTTESVE
ncbi:MAG: hypothetical protein WC761_05980 [Candidatus Paceibacterota bacterium]